MNFFQVNIVFDELVAALSMALENYGSQSLIHGQRCSIVAEKIATELYPESSKDIFYAALLHDIGAVDTDSHISFKTFSREELQKEIWEHPKNSSRIFKKIKPLAGMADIVLNHHEHHDGDGYPNALKGDEIPELSQLMLFADYYDVTLRNHPEFTVDEVLRKFQDKRGTYFNESLLDNYLQVVSENKEYFHGLKDQDKIDEMLHPILKKYKEYIEEEELEDSLEVFADIIDSKHRYTKGHSERVAQLAMSLAEEMGVSDIYGSLVEMSGLLHDLGKLATPVDILDKPGRLTDDEYTTVRYHPAVSQSILECFESLYFLAEIVGCHHEHFDGGGYPHGYQGDDIPLISRILAVADMFDALTSSRAYRKAMPIENAISLLKEVSGTQLDPEIVEAAVRVFPNITFSEH